MTVRTDREPIYTMVCDRCQTELPDCKTWNPIGWNNLQVYGAREGVDTPIVWDGNLCSDCIALLREFLGPFGDPRPKS